MKDTLSKSQIDEIVGGQCRDPFAVLGPHRQDGRGTVVRAFWPEAECVRLVSRADGRTLAEMDCLHLEGLFEASLPEPEAPDYRLAVTERSGYEAEVDDPYSIGPLLTEFDLHLLGEGTHLTTFEKLGAHVRRVGELDGVHFAVWAPNARRVSVVGDFNQWDGRRHPMRFHPGAGIWEMFVPGLPEGAIYKFELIPQQGGPPMLKSDPYAFACERRPKTAAVVHTVNGYQWGDQDWLQRRAETNWLESPVSIYEVHLGSWRRSPDDPAEPLGYRDLAVELADYVVDMGYTHVELLPVAEHPLDESWGYQVMGYFAPTSRYGTPEDLMFMIDYLHQRGIGVILDWVPAHFPRDAHGLARFDGTCLYEHADPRRGEHRDWGTLIFNYGRNEVRNFLLSNALFWLDKYHFDGLRVDAVASMLYLDYSREDGDWLPNEYGGNENIAAVNFVKRFNELVYERHPGAITIAEESTAWAAVSRPTYVGGLGFTFKWNLGLMNDTLRYMHRDPIHRKYYHNDMTFSLMYCFTENFVVVLSHDEVVHGKGALLDKMPGDTWQRFANLRLLYGYCYGHPGKKLLFMGGEFGQWQEWRDHQSLDWHLLEYPLHGGVQSWVRDLNHLYRSEPALYEVDFEYAGFQWLDLHNADASVLAWMRRAKDPSDSLVFVCNFTPVVRHSHLIGVPQSGYYREILNSDSELYGGSNVGNAGKVCAQERPCHEFPYALELTLPPLAVVVLKPE